MIKRLLFLLIAIFSLAAGLEAETVKAEGKVTYLTADQVYVDIGSDVGVAVGDTLLVFRRNEELGPVVITNVARKSSVCQSLIPVEVFQLGDRVVLEKEAVPEPTPVEEVVEPTIEAAKPSKRQDRILSQRGNASARYSMSSFSGGDQSARGIASLRYGLVLTSPFRSDIWLYGRGNLTESDFTLYQARFTVGDRRGKFYLQLGRIFAPELAGIGATDGVMLTSQMASALSVGALGGFQPDPLRLSFDSKVKKVGAFVKFKQRTPSGSLDAVLSGVGQYAGKDVDREFIYGRLSGDYFNRKVTFSIYETVDFYRGDSPANRGTVTPTSSQFSVGIRPWKGLSIRSRYSDRRQIIYQVSGSTLPDSLFEDALRSGWYNSIRLSHDAFGSIQAGFNLRQQSDSDDRSELYLVNYRSNASAKGQIFDVGGSYLQNLLITGARGQLGFSAPAGKKMDLYAQYELFSYGYGNSVSDYRQHTISASLNWRIMKYLRGSLSLDYSKDEEFSIFYIYMGLNWRI
ncbi:MAG: hypothetical protein QF712_01775 [Candidatus Marinimicrobia bacterium]|jgi:hypothetical protein|nr:hypothetical protein [Candidatus Neomarinimicrobiota bacterium]|tara:strand:- start:4296 stop:5843 length:1548 start_codon:yes stop_codon:yes gene_type:complete